jgi:hypothetical protein
MIALEKSGWIIEFHTYEARIYQPAKPRPKIAFRAVYKMIPLDPRNPSWIGPLSKDGLMFSLKEPWNGFSKVEMPPDFIFLRQFVASILELSNKTGRAPATLHLMNHIYCATKKVLSQKMIRKALLQGEGYFWTTKTVRNDRGPGTSRLFYVIPGRTTRDAEQIYREKRKQLCSSGGAGLSM